MIKNRGILPKKHKKIRKKTKKMGYKCKNDKIEILKYGFKCVIFK